MKLDSFKTIVIEQTDHEAFMLEIILEASKEVENIASGAKDYRDKLLTKLSKERVRKV